MRLTENGARKTNRDKDKVVITCSRLCSSLSCTFFIACSSLAFLLVLKFSLFELWPLQSEWFVVSLPQTLMNNERSANCLCELSEMRERNEQGCYLWRKI